MASSISYGHHDPKSHTVVLQNNDEPPQGRVRPKPAIMHCPNGAVNVINRAKHAVTMFADIFNGSNRRTVQAKLKPGDDYFVGATPYEQVVITAQSFAGGLDAKSASSIEDQLGLGSELQKLGEQIRQSINPPSVVGRKVKRAI